MKKLKLAAMVILAGLLIISCNNKKEPAKEETTQKELTEKEKQEMAKEYAEKMHAGDQHKILTGFVGDWKFKSSLKSLKGETIYSSEGITSNKLILDGKFLVSESTKTDTNYLLVGHMILGFDRGLGKFTVVIYSDGGTNYVTSFGAPSGKSNVITTSGEHDNSLLKHKEMYDIDFNIIRKDSYQIEMRFRDQQTRSTMSSLVLDYERLSQPQPDR